MVNPIRLQNYLHTTEITPASCAEFPDEAFSALWGLVHYAFLVPSARHAWLRAVTVASFNKAGTLSPKGGNKNFFYIAVLHRKNSAFGYAEAPPQSGQLNAAAFPWALDDPSFEALKAKALAGEGLSGAKEMTWEQANQAYKDLTNKYGLATPLAAAGGFYLKKVVQSYAPELLELVGPEVLIPATAAAFAALAVSNWTIRMEKAETKRTFQIDDVRRQFDRTVPLGSDIASR